MPGTRWPMLDHWHEDLAPMRAGILLALLAILYGFGLGAAFGAAEDSIKQGLGALGYGSYWMFLGMRAPGMGSTGAAKESLAWLAIPSAGLCILGLLAVIVLVARAAFRKPRSA